MGRMTEAYVNLFPGSGRERRRWPRVLLGILGGVVVVYLALLAVNYGFSQALRGYIRDFEPVDYDMAERVVPVYDEALGHYTIQTDRDVKVMMLSDIHLGGGCWTYHKEKNDLRDHLHASTGKA